MRRANVAALLALLLAGCAVDDNTGEVKGPIFVGSALAYGATHSRTTPEPAEWRAFCRQDFGVHWRAPRPPPSGLVLDGFSPVSVASALRRAGAAYVEGPVDAERAKASGGLFAKAGRYRLSPTGAPGCDAWLDQVIAAWLKADSKFREQAARCLNATPIGDYAAPYSVGQRIEHRTLAGGAFDLMTETEMLVERRTGAPAAEWVSSASLTYQPPDRDKIYWGGLSTCGPNSGRHRVIALTDHPLFAAGG